MTENKLTYDTVITTNAVGFNKKMGVAHVMELFQYALTLQTYDTCIGFDRLIKEQNAKWIISRIRFEFDGFPQNGDTVRVETWPLSPGRLRFERSFELYCGDKKTARAISDWVIIDADTSAPRRANSVPMPFDDYLTARAVETPYSQYSEEVDEDDLCYIKEIRVSDLDLNGHVNNISYIRMATDCFSTEEIEKLDIRSFEMYYREQCFEGDRICIYRKGDYIEAKKEGITVFRAVLNK